MRIAEKLSHAGYFWLPKSSDDKVAGILTIGDGGDIRLELFGSLHNAQFDDEAMFQVNGEIEKAGYCTLLNCFYTTNPIDIGVGVIKSKIVVNAAILNAAISEEELEIESFSFATEGLDEWIRQKGISVEFSDSFRSAKVEYNANEKITYELSKDLKLNICFKYSLPGVPAYTEAVISQSAFFQLESNISNSLDHFLTIAHRINSFICFALDKTVAVRDVTISSSKITRETPSKKSAPVPLKLYYSGIYWSEKIPKTPLHEMIFSFSQIEKDFGGMINRWLDAYESVSPALDLYFATKNDSYKYSEGVFLALAQGIETYHRRTSQDTQMPKKEFKSLLKSLLEACPVEWEKWLSGRLSFANELSLAQRLDITLSAYQTIFGNKEEIQALVRKIVDTRNYLTHYDLRLRDKAAIGVDIFPLISKLELVFQLCFLSILGFEKTEVEEIIKNSAHLKRKVSGAISV